MAQPDLLMMDDGSLILDEEASQTLLESGDQGIVRHIRIRILPEILGRKWKRTGAPIGGAIFITVASIVLCAFLDFEQVTMAAFYTYITSYFGIIAAFMVMRYYEPEQDPPFKVPYGAAGAWTLMIIAGCTMGFIAVY